MIEDLLKTIRERKNSSPDKSYTSYLLSGGLGKCIEKLEEELNQTDENDNTEEEE